MEEKTNSVAEKSLSFEELVENTKAFEKIINFPTSSNKIEKVAKSSEEKREVERHARETKAILHKEIKILITEFLDFKRKEGSEEEKQFYKEMNTTQFITRLISKRFQKLIFPIIFLISSSFPFFFLLFPFFFFPFFPSLLFPSLLFYFFPFACLFFASLFFLLLT